MPHRNGLLTRGFAEQIAKLATGAVDRFPVSVLFVLLFALLANHLVFLDHAPDRLWQLLFSLLAGVGAATSGHLWLESRGRAGFARFALPGAAAVVLAALSYRSHVPLVEVTLLVLVAILFVPVAPFLRRAREGVAFWAFAVWGSIGGLLAFVAVSISISGLTLVLEIVRLLFGVGLDFEAYVHVYVTALGLVGPLFALASLPRTAGEEVGSVLADDRLTRLVRPIVEWIAPSLLLLQALVLHVYAPFALVREDVGLEAGILASSFLVGLVLLRIAIHPFRDDLAAPARLFSRIWLLLLAVPLGLVAEAVATQAGTAGITSETYALVASALAVLAVAAIQIVPRWRGDIVVMSVLPLFAMFTAAVGPLSLANVVGRSQATLVEERYGSAVRSEETLSAAGGEGLRDAVIELSLVRQLWRIEPVLRQAGLSSGYDGVGATVVVDRLLTHLGVPSDSATEAAPEALRVLEADMRLPLLLEGFDTAFLALYTADGVVGSAEGEGAIVGIDGRWIIVRWQGVEDRFDLGSRIRDVPTLGWNAGPVPLEPWDLVSADGRTVRVRPEYLSMAGDGRLDFARLALLLRAAEWGSLGGNR